MSDLDETPLPLAATLEALLFVAGEPATPAYLATVIGISVDEVEEGLRELGFALYRRGLRLQEHSGVMS